MGNWYTNISLRGAKQSDVVAALEELGRLAYVTPSIGHWILLYDQECDKFDLDTLESLALTLSTRLSCTAFASFNADDDILWLGVFENGKRTTRYSSDRAQFEDGAEFPPIEEVSAVLCRIFDKPENVRQVQKTLRTPHGLLGFFSTFTKLRLAYLFEVLRHGDLQEILEMPPGSVGLGYDYVERGEEAPGLSREMMRRTLSG
jgi:hypothetical protein